ncbi:NAD(P)/FAD-dependent oxidoreductase [Intrasporangium mesophilum]
MSGQDTNGVTTERFATVVIGGGQAGLVMGYHLQRAGVRFVILDAGRRVGDSWRERYDSLRLFSMPTYASLPGWRMPQRTFPTRDQMADYLEQYAARFELPVRNEVSVLQVTRDGDGFLVDTSSGLIHADTVVVAAGAHRVPVVPRIEGRLRPSIRQVHSLEYRNEEQLAPGGVLVVGAANSGTDIALESAAAGHPTWLSGRHPGQVPIDIDSGIGIAMTPIIMFVFRHVLTLRTPMGRKAARQAEDHGVNLVRNKVADLDAAGVVRVGRVVGITDGCPVTEEDGILSDISTVVWATGSRPDHSFLHGLTDDSGRPPQDRGVSDVSGLYFLGLEFQFAQASGTIQGLDRDARYLVRRMRPVWARTAGRAEAGAAAAHERATA